MTIHVREALFGVLVLLALTLTLMALSHPAPSIPSLPDTAVQQQIYQAPPVRCSPMMDQKHIDGCPIILR